MTNVYFTKPLGAGQVRNCNIQDGDGGWGEWGAATKAYRLSGSRRRSPPQLAPGGEDLPTPWPHGRLDEKINL